MCTGLFVAAWSNCILPVRSYNCVPGLPVMPMLSHMSLSMSEQSTHAAAGFMRETWAASRWTRLDGVVREGHDVKTSSPVSWQPFSCGNYAILH